MNLFDIVFLPKNGELSTQHTQGQEISVMVAANGPQAAIDEGFVYLAKQGKTDVKFIACSQVGTKTFGTKAYRNFTIAP